MKEICTVVDNGFPKNKGPNIYIPNLPSVIASPYERWIKHNGRRILVNQYTGLNIKDIPTAVEANKEAIIKRNRKKLLVLVDITDAYANKEILELFKRTGAELNPYIHKSAIIGAVGVQKFFLRLVNTFSGMNTKAFDEERAALDWLTE